MESILISIVIPSFNSNEYLQRTIISFGKIIHNNNVEFIIIDDCSQTNQKKFLPKKIKNLKFYRNKKNKGLSISRNIGVELSSGKYIVFFDSDDIVIEKEFNNVLEKIRIFSTENYDLFRVGIIKNNKNYMPKENTFNDLTRYLIKVFLIDKFTTITSVTHIYRRDLLLDNKFPNQKIYSEDLYHFFIITEKIKYIKTLENSYYIHNQDNINSITKTKKIEMTNDQFIIYKYLVSNCKNRSIQFIGYIFYRFIYLNKMKGKKIKKINKLMYKNLLFIIFKYLLYKWGY